MAFNAAKLRADASFASLQALALDVHARLCAAYGCPVPYFHRLDPLEELISSSLSHRTKNADSGRSFKELKRVFPDWESVRDAPVAEVQEAIRWCTWPEQKAPRIQALLHEITTRCGMLNLDFLGEMEVRAARDWLESMTGVGPKTSAAVLNFSILRMPALPVDSHHHRVAERLGLIPPRTDVGRSHALLERLMPEGWNAQQVFDHHEVYMFHGQRCCFYQKPNCRECVLFDLCPTGQICLAERADNH